MNSTKTPCPVSKPTVENFLPNTPKPSPAQTRQARTRYPKRKPDLIDKTVWNALSAPKKLSLYATLAQQNLLTTNEYAILVKTSPSATRPTRFRLADPNTYQTLAEYRPDLIIYDPLEEYHRQIQEAARANAGSQTTLPCPTNTIQSEASAVPAARTAQNPSCSTPSTTDDGTEPQPTSGVMTPSNNNAKIQRHPIQNRHDDVQGTTTQLRIMSSKTQVPVESTIDGQNRAASLKLVPKKRQTSDRSLDTSQTDVTNDSATTNVQISKPTLGQPMTYPPAIIVDDPPSPFQTYAELLQAIPQEIPPAIR